MPPRIVRDTGARVALYSRNEAAAKACEASGTKNLVNRGCGSTAYCSAMTWPGGGLSQETLTGDPSNLPADQIFVM
ncbi:MAG: hypothetical protein M3500_16990 [Actinomycetota bacterium]|nr:hypothetical protein [Actinomycetota bacterium]